MTQRKQTEFQHGFDRLTVKGQQQDSIEFGLRAEVAWLTGKVGELRAVLADIDTRRAAHTSTENENVCGNGKWGKS
jgi:hypothetical protein